MTTPQQGSESQVNVGDLVVLNSGGPEMKITAINHEQITTEWDGGNGTFPIACLTLVRQSVEAR